MPKPRHICIALFGGNGTRFNAPYPKQFVLLGEEPMLLVTLKGLTNCGEIDEIYVVSERTSLEKVYNLVHGANLNKVQAIIPGGNSRQDSSRLALEYLQEKGIENDALVMIVDGDRPCVDPIIVSESYLEAAHFGASVVAIPVTDSMLYSEDGVQVDHYLERSKVYAVQTPQTFRFGLIYEAAERFKDRPVTDDASLIRLAGGQVALVKGSPDNIKITVPADVETYLHWRKKKL